MNPGTLPHKGLAPLKQTDWQQQNARQSITKELKPNQDSECGLAGA